VRYVLWMRHHRKGAHRTTPERGPRLQGRDVLLVVQPALPYPGRAMVGARKDGRVVVRAIFAGVLLAGVPVYAVWAIFAGLV